jgi:hypothetical protein
MHPTLTAEQEAEAQLLAQRIAHAAEAELLQIARTLVAADTAHLFGTTEFQVRDLILRVAAKAYQEHLAQKKTATKAPASSAPTAARPPPFTATARGVPSACSAPSATAALTTTVAAVAKASAPSTTRPGSAPAT